MTIPLILGMAMASQATAQQEDLVPDWIETTAGFWVEGHVGDQEFLNAMKHLIDEKIITISQNEKETSTDNISELNKNTKLQDMISKLEDENSKLKKTIMENQYSDCSLRGEEVDLEGCNLSGADLSHANLPDAHLTNANLSFANIFGAYLPDAFMPRVNLSYSDLSSSHMPHVKMPDANLSSVNLHNAFLGGADLYQANLPHANLSDADFRGAYFTGANLYRANLSGAYLTDADFSGAILSDAVFTNTIDQPKESVDCIGKPINATFTCTG